MEKVIDKLVSCLELVENLQVAALLSLAIDILKKDEEEKNEV